MEEFGMMGKYDYGLSWWRGPNIISICSFLDIQGASSHMRVTKEQQAWHEHFWVSGEDGS